MGTYYGNLNNAIISEKCGHNNTTEYESAFAGIRLAHINKRSRVISINYGDSANSKRTGCGNDKSNNN